MCLQLWHLVFQASLNWENSLLLVKCVMSALQGETPALILLLVEVT